MAPGEVLARSGDGAWLGEMRGPSLDEVLFRTAVPKPRVSAAGHRGDISFLGMEVTRRRVLLAALSIAMIPGCGFRLRGNVQLPFQTIFVEGLPSSLFAAQLKRLITGGGGTILTASAGEAQAIVSLMTESQERSILAVSGGGRVREQQLRYRVSFRVHSPSGTEWLAPGEVLVARDMTYDDTQVLAKEGEAQALFREMQMDAARQVVRRIEAIRAGSAEGEP